MLLYGGGLRLGECLDLRVKDVDLDRGQIVVRRGKGGKDRTVPLPSAVADPLRRHLADVAALHHRDLANGLGRVVLPDAISAKYPHAAIDWRWQFVVPAGRICRDARYGLRRGIVCTNRRCSGRWPKPGGWRDWPSACRATRFATRSRRTCSNTGMTSGRSRSCSATVT